MSELDKQFVELLKKYEKLAFSICYKMTQNYFDAEDLTQETFIAVYKSLSEFDGVNPGGFITRIATNKCLDYLKRADRRATPTEDDVLFQNVSASPSPETNLLRDEVERELKCACISLKPPYNEVATEYYCNGRTAAEIADSTGKNIKTIQTQIRRAKEMLQKKIKKEQVV